MMKIIPIVLAGGIGSRLWPFSKPDNPKPFTKLPKLQKSLFASTVERLELLPDVSHYVVVANRKYRYLLNNEMRKSRLKGECILEPCAKNTLAAVLVATLFVQKKYGDDCQILILPSDHVIKNNQGFVSAILSSQQYVQMRRIVTFGIVPNGVETGYGYIHCDGSKVLNFIEKPNFALASKLIKEGNCLWNAGIFSFKPSVFIEEAKYFCKETFSALEDVDFILEDGAFIFDQSRYDKLDNISVDYAIIEKTNKSNLGWSDVGTWGGFESIFMNRDKDGNSSEGAAVSLNCKGTSVIAQDRPVVTIGVKDLVVVSNSEATLIVHKNDLQSVKELSGYELISSNIFAKVQRPWGSYQVIDYGEGFKVKRIEVLPGGRLSLQLHHHRDEHWTVVEGNATVIKGTEKMSLSKNQAIFIPREVQHRLSNENDVPCIIIEVQMGDYLGEDDIVRLQDSYNRN